MIFKTKASKERAIEVIAKLKEFKYRPNQTNAFELYAKAGSDWQEINLNELDNKEWKDSWEDMPQEMIDYIKSLPEYDEETFKHIVKRRTVEDVLADLSDEDKEIIKPHLK